jgi:hypothetical protein
MVTAYLHTCIYGHPRLSTQIHNALRNGWMSVGETFILIAGFQNSIVYAVSTSYSTIFRKPISPNGRFPENFGRNYNNAGQEFEKMSIREIGFREIVG